MVIEEANDWYFAMLRDSGRNDFYRKALQSCVEGRTVLDVGAGCGLLSLLAAQLGARKVIAIEGSREMARLARVNAERNGYGDTVRVINALSSEVVLSEEELADVVVSETFGTLLLGEGALEHLADARRRLAHPGARVVPGRGAQYALLVTSPTLAALSSAPAPADCCGLDLSAANCLQDTASIYFTKDRGVRLGALPDLEQMAPRALLAQVDFSSAAGPRDVPKTVSVELEAQRAGVVHAIVTSWEILSCGEAESAADEADGGPAACRLSTHHEETAHMPWGLFRDLQWGQGVQLVEDHDAAPRRNRRRGSGPALPVPFAVEAGEPLVLTARFSEPDRQALQLRLRRRGSN